MKHKSRKAALEDAARRLHTHTVVFEKNSLEETVVAMAQIGQSNQEIARSTGLSLAQVQYRISKAQREAHTRWRSEFRNGGGLAHTAILAVMDQARKVVREQVAPAYLPLALSKF